MDDEATQLEALRRQFAPFGMPMPFSFGQGEPQQMPADPMAEAMQSGAIAHRETLPRHGLPDERQSAARLFADAATASTWPYIAAGLKKLTGYDDGASFDDLRRQEQGEVARAREQYPTWAQGADVVAPAMTGLGAGARAATVPQAARRAAIGAGAYGGVSGYASPVEPDSLDVAARLPGAMTGAGVAGALGWAIPRGMGEAQGRFGAYFAERTAQRQAAEAAEQRAIAETRQRRSEAAQRGAETRARNRDLKAEFEAEKLAEAAVEAAKQKRLAGREDAELARHYEGVYNRAPETPPASWKAARKAYREDPGKFIIDRIHAGRDLASIADEANLSQIQVARKIAVNELLPKNPRYFGFRDDVGRALRAEEAWKRRMPGKK